ALLDDQNVRKAFYEHGLIAGTRTALTTASSMSVVRSSQIDRPAVAAATPVGAATPPPPTPPSRPPPILPPSYLSTNMFVLALLGSLTGDKTAGGQPIPTFADLETAIQKLPATRFQPLRQPASLSSRVSK